MNKYRIRKFSLGRPTSFVEGFWDGLSSPSKAFSGGGDASVYPDAAYQLDVEAIRSDVERAKTNFERATRELRKSATAG